MKIFILMMCRILKKPLGLVLVIIQVTLAMIVLNASTGQISYLNYTARLLNNKDSIHLFYLSINTPDVWIIDYHERMKTVADLYHKIENINGIEYIFNMENHTVSVDDYKNDKISLITYPNNLFQYKPLLQSGQWIGDIKPKEGIYPVVVSNRLSNVFNIGDQFDSYVMDEKYVFEVCGILKSPNLVMDFHIGGTYMYWSDFFQEYDDVILANHLYQGNDIVHGYNRSKGIIIKLKDDLFGQEREKTIQKILKYGNLLSFKEINEKNKEIINNKMKKYAVNYVLFILLGILSIVGVSVL